MGNSIKTIATHTAKQEFRDVKKSEGEAAHNHSNKHAEAALPLEEEHKITTLPLKGEHKITALPLKEERKAASLLLKEERNVATLLLKEERNIAALPLEEECKVAALPLKGNRKITALPLKNVRQSVDLHRRFWKDAAIGAIFPVVLIAIWQVAVSTELVSEQFLSSPYSIAKSFFTLLFSEQLLHHLLVSVQRAGIGFIIGGFAGFLLGILTGLFRKAQYVLDPSIQVLRLVPNLAIVPLIILWFGFGELSKIAIIISSAFFPLYINVFTGIRNVDQKLFEVARVLGFKPVKRLVRLILPAALPDIFNGVRISLAVSWIGLVVAELVGSQAGIGFLINEAKQNSDTSVIFVGIIVFAVVGKLIDSAMKAIEARWLDWRDSFKG